MCQAKVAVDMLKNHKSLTKGDIIMVFEKVIEDQKATAQDVRDVKKDLGELKLSFFVFQKEIKDIKELILEKRKSFWDKIPLLKDVPNLAWFLLIVIVCVIASLLGANLDFLKDSLRITNGT